MNTIELTNLEVDTLIWILERNLLSGLSLSAPTKALVDIILIKLKWQAGIIPIGKEMPDQLK
jgi:hypothetical protein